MLSHKDFVVIGSAGCCITSWQLIIYGGAITKALTGCSWFSISQSIASRI